jgi:hypothetical protein
MRTAQRNSERETGPVSDETDITEITATDPKQIFVEIDKRIRPDAGNRYLDGTTVEAYYSTLKHASLSLGVEFNVKEPASSSEQDPSERLRAIKEEIDKKKIDILVETTTRKTAIQLDTAWRDKIHSYILHIRNIVNSADNVPAPIKEGILRKLSELDTEVDRGRTTVQIITDVFVELCAGVSSGAKALIPAVKIGERIIGALARLKEQPPTLALPSPDQFDLPSPEMMEADPHDATTA